MPDPLGHAAGRVAGACPDGVAGEVGEWSIAAHTPGRVKAHVTRCLARCGLTWVIFVRNGSRVRKSGAGATANVMCAYRAVVWHLAASTPMEGYGEPPSFVELARATHSRHNTIIAAVKRLGLDTGRVYLGRPRVRPPRGGESFSLLAAPTHDEGERQVAA